MIQSLESFKSEKTLGEKWLQGPLEQTPEKGRIAEMGFADLTDIECNGGTDVGDEIFWSVLHNSVNATPEVPSCHIGELSQTRVGETPRAAFDADTVIFLEDSCEEELQDVQDADGNETNEHIRAVEDESLSEVLHHLTDDCPGRDEVLNIRLPLKVSGAISH